MTGETTTECLDGQAISVVGGHAYGCARLLDMQKKLGRPRRTMADRKLMRDVGKRLRWVRQAMGLSQEAIADLVGKHQTTWSLYERGERLPDEFEIMRILARLRITRDYLLLGSLEGVEPRLAIRLAASHPELVPPIGNSTDKGKNRA